MRKLNPMTLCGAAIFAAACYPPPAENLVSATVTTTMAEVDSFCSEGACGRATVGVDVHFGNDDWLPSSAEIDVAQYRVDYIVDGIGSDIPYYANTAMLTIPAGTTGALEVQVAGDTQRDYVYAEGGGDAYSGTARLSLACFDHRGKVFVVETPFDISFANLEDEAVDEGTDDPDDTDDTGWEG